MGGFVNTSIAKMCQPDKRIEIVYVAEWSSSRDANFYGLPVVITENGKKFQFSMDYEKLEFFYGNFLKK